MSRSRKGVAIEKESKPIHWNARLRAVSAAPAYRIPIPVNLAFPPVADDDRATHDEGFGLNLLTLGVGGLFPC